MGFSVEGHLRSDNNRRQQSGLLSFCHKKPRPLPPNQQTMIFREEVSPRNADNNPFSCLKGDILLIIISTTSKTPCLCHLRVLLHCASFAKETTEMYGSRSYIQQ